MDVSPRSLTEVPTPPGSDGSAGAPGGGNPGDGGRGPQRPRSAGRARWRGWVLGLVAVAALGFVAFRGLGNATLFFYNADEAVAKKVELGSDRFRLQGSVEDGELDRQAGAATFLVSYNEVAVPVEHRGEIPKLFQPGVPVVLEGRWDGEVFASDRMLIKHNEVYVEANPDRVSAYGEGSEAGAGGEAGASSGAATKVEP